MQDPGVVPGLVFGNAWLFLQNDDPATRDREASGKLIRRSEPDDPATDHC